MPLPIEGPRVVLRDWTFTEHDEVLRYASDPDVVRYMPWGPHKTSDDVEEFFTRIREHQREQPRRYYELAVEWKETGEVIGGAGLRMPDPNRPSNGEIGYVFRKEHWGKGLATEVAELLCDFGFTEFSLHRIAAGVDTDNIASQRVLEKVGMRREAHLREDIRRRGEWRDTFVYAILEGEWRARRHASH
jgi:RimJ/RimL family protein N-acetyltransferase